MDSLYRKLAQYPQSLFNFGGMHPLSRVTVIDGEITLNGTLDQCPGRPSTITATSRPASVNNYEMLLIDDDTLHQLETSSTDSNTIGICTRKYTQSQISVEDDRNQGAIVIRSQYTLGETIHHSRAGTQEIIDHIRDVVNWLHGQYPDMHLNIRMYYDEQAGSDLTFFPADFPQSPAIAISAAFLDGTKNNISRLISADGRYCLAARGILPETVKWFSKIRRRTKESVMPLIPGNLAVVEQVFQVCDELGLEFRCW